MQKHNEQIEALTRRFDEQDAQLLKQDAELQDLRRQIAAGPEASGRRLQKGTKSSKGNGSGGGSGSLTAKQLSIIDALDNCMELSNSTDELIVQGCDFIVRGNGNATHVDLNTTDGKGNLIVGWNEGEYTSLLDNTTVVPNKTGLNNIIVGPGHSYSSTGGVVFGQENTISAPYASVGGGRLNKASGEGASVSGGAANNANADAASVSGGFNNTANGDFASVSGGEGNTASGQYASVFGGSNNYGCANTGFPNLNPAFC